MFLSNLDTDRAVAGGLIEFGVWRHPNVRWQINLFPKENSPVDIHELFGKKMLVQTSQGTVYVRPLGSGSWSSVSKNKDLSALGQAAVRLLTGPIEAYTDESSLSDDVYALLTPDDIQLLSASIARHNGLGELPVGTPPYEALGALIAERRVKDAEKAKKQREQLMSAAFGGLGTSTVNSLMDKIRGVDEVRDALRHSSALDIFNSTYSHDAEQISRLNELHIPDVASTPIGRAAAASERTAEAVATVADLTSKLVLKTSEMAETFMFTALPEWRKQLESEKAAADESNRQATANLEIAQNSLGIAARSLHTARWTLWLTLGLAIVSLAAQYFQSRVTEKEAAEERVTLEAAATQRHELIMQTLREQLEAQRALLKQQNADNEALRAALAELKPPPSSQPAPSKK